ncbi:hypothetical protein F5Y19DRAFT_485588 [Xylariaceae sp. FL1651]|nr:hypothetical protein F5Y19DRAFT_485588 [Xylariaceae sp. FL1651]
MSSGDRVDDETVIRLGEDLVQHITQTWLVKAWPMTPVEYKCRILDWHYDEFDRQGALIPDSNPQCFLFVPYDSGLPKLTNEINEKGIPPFQEREYRKVQELLIHERIELIAKSRLALDWDNNLHPNPAPSPEPKPPHEAIDSDYEYAILPLLGIPQPVTCEMGVIRTRGMDTLQIAHFRYLFDNNLVGLHILLRDSFFRPYTDEGPFGDHKFQTATYEPRRETQAELEALKQELREDRWLSDEELTHWSYRPIDDVDIHGEGPLYIDDWYPLASDIEYAELARLVRDWGVRGVFFIPTCRIRLTRGTGNEFRVKPLSLYLTGPAIPTSVEYTPPPNSSLVPLTFPRGIVFDYSAGTESDQLPHPGLVGLNDPFLPVFQNDEEPHGDGISHLEQLNLPRLLGHAVASSSDQQQPSFESYCRQETPIFWELDEQGAMERDRQETPVSVPGSDQLDIVMGEYREESPASTGDLDLSVELHRMDICNQESSSGLATEQQDESTSDSNSRAMGRSP